MPQLKFCGVLAIAAIVFSPAPGAEPNNSFATSTVLSTGVLSIADELTLATIPDTLLGARDVSGVIGRVDDDSSPLGDGRASGLTGVSVNSETLQFSVSGFGDSVEDGEFSGGHFEQGEYEVFVHVFDSMGAEISMFSQLSQLSAGLVEDFEFSNPAWMGVSYNV
jgi:hypothetical protein